MSRGLIVPLAVLLVTVGGLLGCAAWNRRAAEQRLTLTEREVGLPWQWGNASDDDDGVLRVRLDWQRRDGPLDERTWLTEDKLRAIGFNLSIPAGAPEARRHYERMLPRIAWVALEYDGPAFQEIERRRRLQTTDAVVRAPVETSRLVPIDAGPDREALMRRHASSGTLILPAIFDIAYLAPEMPGGPLIYGHVQGLVEPELTISRRSRAALADLRGRDGGTGPEPPSPRFEVDIAVGRLGFPWVTDVRRTAR
jgi:hypothetical protein